MSSYRFVRQGGQEKEEYSLDFILQEELGIRKLKFTEADGYHRLEWRTSLCRRTILSSTWSITTLTRSPVMSQNSKQNDLSQSVPIGTDISDFTRFDSQTKRFADKYHYFLLERKGEMIATIPPAEKKDGLPGQEDAPDYIGDFDDEDEDGENSFAEGSLEDIMANKDDVLSLKNWIVTLKSHMSVLGLPLIEEAPDLNTLIRCFVYDSDAVSAYPTCTAVRC